MGSKLEQIRALGQSEIARRYAPAAAPKPAPSPKKLETLKRKTETLSHETLTQPATLSVSVCAACGKAFEPKRTTARYCSSKCRLVAHRATPKPT